MGKGLKLTSPLVARMGIEPWATRFSAKNVAQSTPVGASTVFSRSRQENRIERRWLNTELAKAICTGRSTGVNCPSEVNRV